MMQIELANSSGDLEMLGHAISEFKSLQLRAQALQEQEETAEPVTAMIEAFKNQPELTENLNKHVFRSATRTAQISSFFRQIKLVSPGEWNSFFQEIANLNITPSVNTPVTWEKNQ